MPRGFNCIALLLSFALSSAAALNTLHACTSILVGSKASVDGSVLMATSCDGGMMGRVYVMPERNYPPGSRVPMYYDWPAPKTWEEHARQRQQGYTLVGQLPVASTYHCVLVAGHLADSITGGINEHGLSIGIEYMGMKPELANQRGAVSTCSNHWTSSLIANALLRTRTAREAIQLIGKLVEQHGFTYYWAPAAGCALPIVDKNEAWILEIFGPGGDWKPGAGKPGAVWCAQRVPDGEVTCNANRSRIARVDLDDKDHFLASSNIFSLAEELGYWKPDTPFIWHDVYGVPGTRENSLREWAALNRVAPSLQLKATGDPQRDRYPFSVKPDRQIAVADLLSLMRDCYQGTRFDITERPAFRVDGEKSPLARPYGDADLFKLLGIEPERCIASETSGYVYVSQIRSWLPAPTAGCMWCALGPAPTSCFVPIYAGVTEITESWSRVPDFTRIDRSQIQWNLQLVDDLAAVRYQQAIQDVRRVLGPGETALLAAQPDLEREAVRILETSGSVAARRFLTQYTNDCLESVTATYDRLVDYLIFTQLYSYGHVAPREPPRLRAPRIPRRNH